jgi:superfamily I DNA/RNA helicase
VPRNKLADDVVFQLRNPDPDAKITTPIYARLPTDQTATDSVHMAAAAVLDYAERGGQKSLRTAAIALCTMNSLWNQQAGTAPQNVEGIEKCFTSKQMKKNSLSHLAGRLLSTKTTAERFQTLVGCLEDKSIFEAAVRRIQRSYPSTAYDIPEREVGVSLFDALRATRKPKGLDGVEAGNNRIQVLTYQKSKGREFDFVAMVVDQYAESSTTPLDEKRRLYYVCATRANRKLFVIHFGPARMGNVLGPTLSPA